jgi:predicted phage terminase large subunit-like protein
VSVALPETVHALRPKARIEAQRRLWTSRAPYLLYLGGRGAGKTYGGAVWALTREPKSKGLIVAPTHGNLRGGALSALLPLAYGAGLVVQHNKQESWIELIDGKMIFTRSLDRPELIRGLSVSWLWGDELGIEKTKEAWDIIIACVREDEPRQRLVTTTPPPTGERHWLHETFVQRAVAGVHEVIVARTAENPYLPSDYEQDLRREYADAYAARELDARWIDVGAVEVYDTEKLLTAPAGFVFPDLAKTVRSYDTAATGGGGDYTAGVLMSIDKASRLYIRDVMRGQWAPEPRDEMMRRTAVADTSAVPIRVCQERGSAGKSQAVYWNRILIGFSVRAELESGDKVVRAGPFAGQVGAGNVTITCEPGRWENYYHEGQRLSPDAARARFRRNLGMFPHGRTKDESDACAQALQALVRRDHGLGIRSG